MNINPTEMKMERNDTKPYYHNRNAERNVSKRTGENSEEMAERRKQQKFEWFIIFLMVVAHSFFIYSASYLLYQKLQTFLWNILCFHVGGIGGMAGAHRLWAHHSYKATLPLRIILMLFYSVQGLTTYNMYHFIRDHRVHHKFSDTDMDPYNAQRGFFYSHVGWLMLTRHPDSLEKLREMNMDDILQDPVVVFEKKNQFWLILVMSFTIPVVIPVMFWQESWSVALNVNYVRWVLGAHGLWSINSFAHLYGSRPFNKNIFAVQNLFVSMVTTGEGWHNFHHMFPWDYRASDFGFMNVSMHFIRFCKFVGLASDLKTASPDLVKNVMLKYGDGSHPDWVPVGPEVPEEALDDSDFIVPESSFIKGHVGDK